MNRKHAIAIFVLVVGAIITLGMAYCVSNRMIFSYIDVEGIDIQLVNWDLLLAKAEFNFTTKSVFRTPGVIIIEHVEINGTRVDAYPEHPQLETGDSVLFKIYYPYENDTTYFFKFVSQTGANYTVLETAPPY